MRHSVLEGAGRPQMPDVFLIHQLMALRQFSSLSSIIASTDSFEGQPQPSPLSLFCKPERHYPKVSPVKGRKASTKVPAKSSKKVK